MGSRVLVVGGGGREHALVMGLSISKSVDEIHIAPGNAGTSELGTNHDVSANDLDGILELSNRLGIDLVVVGPEGPLVEGLSEKIRAQGISCFGPHMDGAMLEGSKLFAKKAMFDCAVPTGEIHVIESEAMMAVALDDFSPPWVVKRDVLAGGKGVVVTSDRVEAENAILEAIKTDGFVILEKFLAGEEASMLVVMDESGYVCLPASQDHKRVGDGDTGPNTGGMGAYAPAPVLTDEIKGKAIERIVKPMHTYLSSKETPYRGVLYVGLMIDGNGEPSVVEFNVRFGDPETQVTIPLLKSDLYDLLHATSNGNLSSISVEFKSQHCITIVLASEGYPSTPKKNVPLSGHGLGGTEVVDDGKSWISHAGTKMCENTLMSSGGRVISVTGIAADLQTAANISYERIKRIHLDGSHYRTDIGSRALNRD
jgi:phosphoribosylamine--glycine ligase